MNEEKSTKELEKSIVGKRASLKIRLLEILNDNNVSDATRFEIINNEISNTNSEIKRLVHSIF